MTVIGSEIDLDDLVPVEQLPLLPLVLTTRDLARWTGLHRDRLSWYLRGVPRKKFGSSGWVYDLEDLELLRPAFIRRMRERISRDLGLRREMPDYSWFVAPR